MRLPQSNPGARALLTLEELEREHIRAALAATNGNRAHTARILGISERTLYRKLISYKMEEEGEEPEGGVDISG